MGDMLDNTTILTPQYMLQTKVLTMSGNGAQTNNIFAFTGTVLVRKIWGIVTDATNTTTCSTMSFNLFDQTNNVSLCATTGTLSGATVGSAINRKGLVATALSTALSTQVRLLTDANTAGNESNSEFIIVAKNGVVNNIQIKYTGDANTNMAVQWFIEYVPLSADATVTPV